MTDVSHIPSKCRHRGQLSLENNPVSLARKRYWILQKRIRKLSAVARPGTIKYNDEGMACAFYPNTDSRSKRASRLKAELRAEQREIKQFLKKYGYWD